MSLFYSISRNFFGIFLFVLLVTAISSCESVNNRLAELEKRNADKTSQPPIWQPPADTGPHLMLGNPSGAKQDLSDKDNYLLAGKGSVLSYNESRLTANWISWKTTRHDLGDSIPRPDFRPDPRLPDQIFTKVEFFFYSGSGYDRGHIVPSADRFGDRHLNEKTFYMTNIVPQTPALNQYPWLKLESRARALVRQGNDLYTISGVYGTKEVLKRGVTVPTNCWKVIVVVKAGQPISSINKNTRVIAVDMPNIDGIENDDWKKYRTTVRAIEEKTGFDLLSNLPAELQNILETSIDKGK